MINIFDNRQFSILARSWSFAGFTNQRATAGGPRLAECDWTALPPRVTKWLAKQRLKAGLKSKPHDLKCLKATANVYHHRWTVLTTNGNGIYPSKNWQNLPSRAVEDGVPEFVPAQYQKYVWRGFAISRLGVSAVELCSGDTVSPAWAAMMRHLYVGLQVKPEVHQQPCTDSLARAKIVMTERLGSSALWTLYPDWTANWNETHSQALKTFPTNVLVSRSDIISSGCRTVMMTHMLSESKTGLQPQVLVKRRCMCAWFGAWWTRAKN